MASGEMKEENLEALHAKMDILIAGQYVCHVFERKGNLTDSTVWNTGENGDIQAKFKATDVETDYI